MKKFASTLIIAFAMAAMAINTSCTKEYFAPIPAPEVVSFTNDIQPFFNAKCTNCHGNTNPNLEFPDSYDNLINGGYIDLATPENSLLYKKINVGGSMSAYASPTERNLTLKWIEQGAKDN